VVVVPPTDEMSDDVNLVSCKQGEQTLPRGRKCDRTLRIFAVVRSDKQCGLFDPPATRFNLRGTGAGASVCYSLSAVGLTVRTLRRIMGLWGRRSHVVLY